MFPYLTADLRGTGGVLRARAEDFEVEELAAYAPSGDGDHVFVQIEKRGLTTLEAIRLLAGATGAAERDVGSAGLKDRRAVTRQWLSLPPPVTPEAVAAAGPPLADRGVRLLAVARHRHKLRTGHLTGNRFALTVRGLAVPPAQARERAAAVLARLAAPPGAPNWYGEQRFGRDGRNAEVGRAILRGERRGAGRERRLYVSALQSELFNEYLRRRFADRLFDRVLEGDVLQRTDSGAPFTCREPDIDQGRSARGEVVVTGPMFGHAMRGPTPASPAAEREAAVLLAADLTLDAFRPLGRLAPGARRPIAVRPGEPEVAAQDDAIVVRFSLPAGAYATAIAREILKSDQTERLDQTGAP